MTRIVIPKEATIVVTYYINGEEVAEYHPVQMETGGTHLLHLQYFWDVAEDTLDGDFQVWIRMEGAKMDITAGEARGYLMGQGLAADDLDEKKLRYIYISTLPEKRDYIEGNYMDYTGLVMFETLSGISVNVDMVTLHFKDGGSKAFRYIPPKQIHRKRKESD